MKIPFLGWNITLSKKSNPELVILAQQYGKNSTNGAYPRRNMLQLSDDGYKRCVIAFRAVSMIARSASNIPFEVWDGDKLVEDINHPLVKLLSRPNQLQSKVSFFESVFAYYVLHGNSFINRIVTKSSKLPVELWSIRSDRMRVQPGPLGVAGYYLEVSGRKVPWERDPITGDCDILHIKTFNPIDDWYGMSAIEAAAWSIDQHNLAGEWNQAMLQNSSKPSGAIVYTPTENMPPTLSDKQRLDLKAQINSEIVGTKNAARTLILEGGLDWRQISLSPVDMDWLEGKRESAREIALAFDVPPMLIGIPGDNTYSNQREARQAFHEDTVIPKLECIVTEFNNWLCPLYGDNIVIKANWKDSPAFQGQKEKVWASVQSADWLTINEKREATGFPKVNKPEADEVFVNPNMIPLGSETDTGETDEDTSTDDKSVKPNNNDSKTDKKDLESKAHDPVLEVLMQKMHHDQQNPDQGDTMGLSVQQLSDVKGILKHISDGELTAQAAGVLLRATFPETFNDQQIDMLVGGVIIKPTPQVDDGEIDDDDEDDYQSDFMSNNVDVEDDEDEQKQFNPNQPRDANGQFASTGGVGGMGVGGGAGKVGGSGVGDLSTPIEKRITTHKVYKFNSPRNAKEFSTRLKKGAGKAIKGDDGKYWAATTISDHHALLKAGFKEADEPMLETPISKLNSTPKSGPKRKGPWVRKKEGSFNHTEWDYGKSPKR